VLASGDSDFAPLVSKLKENNKTVIGVGVRSSTSELLSSNCDEFIFYDDLVILPSSAKVASKLGNLPKKKHKAFEMVLDAMEALRREDKEVLWSSMVKQTMKRKQPSFSEAAYGYSSFSELVEDGAAMGLFNIAKDEKSGSYIITEVERRVSARAR
jgi:uncharacterized LabA/DUF88 family protein